MNPQIQNQEFMLRESIKHFLTSYHCGSSDFSSFESIFFRLIQTMLDPPLEITWFYSAVTFHAAKLSPQNSPPTRPLIAKDLLNLLVSCSNLSSASKKIALLAPVVYELYNIISENRKKVYVDVESDNVVVCFEDLVRVWTADRGGGQCNFGQNLRVFFPLMSDGTWKGMNTRDVYRGPSERHARSDGSDYQGIQKLSLSSIVKKIAVIAPILYLLYHLEFNFSAKDPGLREEIRIVVEGIVSYISICCSQFLEGGEQRLDSLGVYILGLVRVWTVDQIRTSHDADVLASFFPVLTNEFQQEVTVHLGYLCCVVMNETFFLRLYLKICLGINKEDLHGDVLKLAIQTIKGFQNFYFLDMLLKLLMERSLPVAASLSSEDAFLLHKVLYDAVMLVDYSFYSGRWNQSSDSHSKQLALVWVLVADRAIQFARATNDQARASSYLDAFCESQFVSELIQWASAQAGALDQKTRPDISTPKALIKWLLVLEDQGIRVFDHSMSQLHSKAQKCLSRVDSEPLELELLGENLNQDIFSCNKNDANTEQEMGDPSTNEFPGAFCLMNTKIDASRKRKEALSGLHESRIKQVKRDIFRGSLGEKFQPISSDNRLHCVSEVKNVASDDDMELIG
ncbi:hypothetical protein Sango_2212900 [Sesamum angolense]|uniref:Uncharacterized protein n=1 Tax=Sesamum angolense TaxID=2727404 RepID=A0AAE2BKK9_9LAMI|nr:hypothetical protein Sango_2212900 [Sesamum angolense]